MKLVIVESPHKCETIKKFLGSEYKVVATKGHLDELSTSGKFGFGIDLENGFKPTYVISPSRKSTVASLKKDVAEASEVILATDPDREGEAIAWRTCEILSLNPKTTKRLEFHEITQEAILNAINNPRHIDMNLVYSQEARRIIDRVLGFRLSSIIWKKIKAKSAGRVQTPTLKLIADHEREIANFVPTKFYALSLTLSKDKKNFNVNYVSKDNTARIYDEKEHDKVIDSLKDKAILKEIKTVTRKIESKLPFSTSSLQQEAGLTLHLDSASITSAAQYLYEHGFVTYIRTDGVNMSKEFVFKARKFIETQYGAQYVGPIKKGIIATNNSNPHEAIRVTSLSRTPDVVKKYFGDKTTKEYKLYKLIYERTLASLMKAKEEEVTTYFFDCGGNTFKTSEVKVIFDGYTKIYNYTNDNEEENVSSSLPLLELKDELSVKKINDKEDFTKPPAHYSEAKIIKLMEEAGIGRPSTYSSTISTLKKRKYIESSKGNVTVTELGAKTSFVMNKYFADYTSAEYTAKMETNLDQINEGETTSTKVLNDFYYPFMDYAAKMETKIYQDEEVPVGRLCPVCHAQLVYKTSRFGQFIGCSNYPHCEYRENPSAGKLLDEKCPKCGKPLIERETKNHKKFIGCSGYPVCDYIKPNEAEKVEVVGKCPDCGADLIVKKSKGKKFIGCSNYPKCHHVETYKKSKIEKK